MLVLVSVGASFLESNREFIVPPQHTSFVDSEALVLPIAGEESTSLTPKAGLKIPRAVTHMSVRFRPRVPDSKGVAALEGVLGMALYGLMVLVAVLVALTSRSTASEPCPGARCA